MKQLRTIAVVLTIAIFLSGFQFEKVPIHKNSVFDEAVNYVKSIFSKDTSEEDARHDEQVKIDSSLDLKKLDADEKNRLYEELDGIERDTSLNYTGHDFASVEMIETEEDYYTFILEDPSQKKILYLGYDDCEYCQAFLPKLAKLAEDYGTTVYYYDTSKRQYDASYQDIIDNLFIKSVPHAFIYQEGKPGETVNYNSSMKDIEEFVKRVVN